MSRPGGEQGAEAIALAAEQRFGLRLHDGIRRAVVAAALRLVEEGASPDLTELAARIASAGASDPVVRAVQRAASVGETSLMRMPEQLRALVKRAGAELVRGAPAWRPFRIWSAGCATGEEAYTLAILFRAAFPELELEVVGSDMNGEALATARRALYAGRSLRNARLLPEGPWLLAAGEGRRVAPEIRRLVRFVEHNLVTDPLPDPALGLSGFDVVVCRNVLIYLDPARTARVIRGITAAMRPRSILALAPSECLAARHAEELAVLPRALLLRGPPPAPEEAGARPQVAPARVPEHPPGPPAPAKPPSRSPEPGRAIEELLQEARRALDRGRIDDAARLLAPAVLQAPDDPRPRFLLASAAEAAGNKGRALEELRRVLFLDGGHVPALLSAARLLDAERRAKDAARHRRRALESLAAMPQDATVPELEITAAAAARIARHALARGGAR